MALKSIIFDFDGTIADTLPIFVKGINALSPKFKYDPIKDIEPFRKVGIREVLRQELNLNYLQIISFVQNIRKHIREDLQNAQFFDGMLDVIKELEKHYHLAVISGNQADVIDTVLHKHGITSFDPIIGNTRLKKQRYIKRFLKQFHYNKDQVIYIGDGLGDITSSQKVGIPVISVSRGFHHAEALKDKHPTFLATTPQDILKYIKEI